MHISKYLISFLIGFEVAIAVSKKSFAASTAHLLELLRVEDKLLENLNGFVEKLSNKLLLLKKLGSIETMKTANNLMVENYEEYLGNPINSFSLMKRLHRDWRKWVHYASNPKKEELEHIEEAHWMRKLLPTARDLERAYQGLDDLVNVYDLKPADLAAGSLRGNSKPETALSAQDCYSLAEFCVADQKDDRAEAWFNASLAKITTQKEGKLVKLLYNFSSSKVHRSRGALLIKLKRTTGLY